MLDYVWKVCTNLLRCCCSSSCTRQFHKEIRHYIWLQSWVWRIHQLCNTWSILHCITSCHVFEWLPPSGSSQYMPSPRNWPRLRTSWQSIPEEKINIYLDLYLKRSFWLCLAVFRIFFLRVWTSYAQTSFGHTTHGYLRTLLKMLDKVIKTVPSKTRLIIKYRCMVFMKHLLGL